MKPSKLLVTARSRMGHVTIVVLSVVALMSFSGAPSGCAQSRSGTAPVGRVGLAYGGLLPRFDLQVPDSRGEAASELAVEKGFSWARDLHEGCVYNEIDALAIYIRMGLTPIGMAGGAAYGAIAGESKHKVGKALGDMTGAMAELQVEEALRDKLLLLVQQKSARPVVLLTNAFPDENAFRVPSLMDAYVPLYSDSVPNSVCEPGALDGIDTLLMIRVINHGLSGRDGPNSRLSLNMAVRATLIQASDRSQIFGFYATYDSRSHKFVEWGKSGASLFRAEFETALQSLAGQIVVQSGLHLPPPPAADPIRIVQNH